MTKISGHSRIACYALALLLIVPAVAQAKRGQDDGQNYGRDRYRERGDTRQDYARRDYDEPRAAPQRDYVEPRTAPQRDYAEPRAVPPRNAGMSLDSAVAQARRQGRVLSADVVDDGNGSAYRIKVLTPEGRVRVLYYNAGR